MKNEETFEAGLCVKNTCIKTKGTGEKGSQLALFFSLICVAAILFYAYLKSNSTNG